MKVKQYTPACSHFNNKVGFALQEILKPEGGRGERIQYMKSIKTKITL